MEILYPKFQAFDNNGNFLDGGKVEVYDNLTDIPVATYSDVTLETENTWPVILDARGEARIYATGILNVIIKDKDDVVLNTVLNVYTESDGIVYDSDVVFTDSSVNDVSSTKHGYCPKTPADTTKYLRGDGIWATVTAAATTVNDSDIVFTDNTTNDVSISKHGFSPKAPNDTAKFLRGDGTWNVVTDAALSISDNTNGDVDTEAHGFCPKAPDDTEKFLRGDGTWATVDVVASSVDDEDVSFTDNTTGNVSSTKHGFCPKTPNDTLKYLCGDGSWATVTATATVEEVDDVNVNFTDNTTGNVSTSSHGFTPKAPNDTAKYLRGDGTWATVTATASSVPDTGVTFTDNTTGNVSTTKHGFVPKAPNSLYKFLRSDGTWDLVNDWSLSMWDVTTNNVSTSNHGFCPKAPNETSKFLRGDGTWNKVADWMVDRSDNIGNNVDAAAHGFCPKAPYDDVYVLKGKGNWVKSKQIYPEDFGAVGDASTDDTAALQDAINYAVTGKMELILTQNYRTTYALMIYDSIKISGSGYILPYYPSNSVGIVIATANPVHLSDFRMWGTGCSHGVYCGLGSSSRNSHSTFNDLTINNCANGLTLTTAAYFSISNLRCWYYTGSAVSVANPYDTDEGDSSISDSLFYGSTGGVGVFQSSSGGLKISNSKFLGGAIGIYVAVVAGKATSDLLVANCSLENQTLVGIQLAQGEYGASFANVCLSNNQFAYQPCCVSVVNNFSQNGWIREFNLTGGTMRINGGGNAIWLDGLHRFNIGPIIYSSDGYGGSCITVNNSCDSGVIQRSSYSGYSNYVLNYGSNVAVL